MSTLGILYCLLLTIEAVLGFEFLLGAVSEQMKMLVLVGEEKNCVIFFFFFDFETNFDMISDFD